MTRLKPEPLYHDPEWSAPPSPHLDPSLLFAAAASDLNPIGEWLAQLGIVGPAADMAEKATQGEAFPCFDNLGAGEGIGYDGLVEGLEEEVDVMKCFDFDGAKEALFQESGEKEAGMCVLDESALSSCVFDLQAEVSENDGLAPGNGEKEVGMCVLDGTVLRSDLQAEAVGNDVAAQGIGEAAGRMEDFDPVALKSCDSDVVEGRKEELGAGSDGRTAELNEAVVVKEEVASEELEVASQIGTNKAEETSSEEESEEEESTDEEEESSSSECSDIEEEDESDDEMESEELLVEDGEIIGTGEVVKEYRKSKHEMVSW